MGTPFLRGGSAVTNPYDNTSKYYVNYKCPEVLYVKSGNIIDFYHVQFCVFYLEFLTLNNHIDVCAMSYFNKDTIEFYYSTEDDFVNKTYGDYYEAGYTADEFNNTIEHLKIYDYANKLLYHEKFDNTTKSSG